MGLLTGANDAARDGSVALRCCYCCARIHTRLAPGLRLIYLHYDENSIFSCALFFICVYTCLYREKDINIKILELNSGATRTREPDERERERLAVARGFFSPPLIVCVCVVAEASESIYVTNRVRGRTPRGSFARPYWLRLSRAPEWTSERQSALALSSLLTGKCGGRESDGQ